MTKRYFKHVTGFMDGTKYIMIDEFGVWIYASGQLKHDKHWHPNAVLNYVRTGQFREVTEKDIQ